MLEGHVNTYIQTSIDPQKKSCYLENVDALNILKNFSPRLDSQWLIHILP